MFAIVVGVLGLVSVVADFAVTPLYALFATSNEQAFADAWVGTGMVLWAVRVACSVVLAALLLAGWFWARQSRTPLVLMTAGLLLGWGWRLLTRYLDLWGFGRFAGETDPSADLVRLATISTVVDESVAVASAALLIAGAAMMRHRQARRDISATHRAMPAAARPAPGPAERP